jgi:hypothetical protein
VGSTRNFNHPKLWHTICTVLEGPLGSFLSTSNHNHLPRCLLVRHKCNESNGLILTWLKFASRTLLQIFIKVGSPCWAIVVNLLAYVYTALWFNATTRKVFIIQSPCVNAPHISSCLLCQTCVHMHFIGLATNAKRQQNYHGHLNITSLQFLKTCRYVFQTQTFIILNLICLATSKLSLCSYSRIWKVWRLWWIEWVNN